MFHDLKPYPGYAASGTWEDLTPAHWRPMSMRALAREVSVTDVPDEPMLSVSIKRGVTPQSVVLAQSGKRDGSNVDRSSYKLVEPGNLAYNKMRAWQGAAGLSRYRGIVSPAYVVLRPIAESVDPMYLHHLLRLPAYAAEAARWSYGISSDQWSLRPEHFRQIPVALPPLDEQEAIVRYLAHAHQRINKAIATKRRLIALLDEAMQVEVRRMVLHGLDDLVDARETGLDWLPEVPAHWEVSALRFHYSQELGKMLDAKRITGANLVPYLRNTDVQWGAINTTDLPEMDITEDEYPRYTVRDGDLLVCEGGEVGRAAIWRGTGTLGFQKALHRLRALDDQRDAPQYLFWLLRCAVWADAFNDGRVSTIAHLTGDKLRAHRFPWPSYDEQQEIATAVNQFVAAADTRRDVVQREVELLEEFRTRLTADVVTGQVDVRSIAASLPPIDPAEAFTAAPGSADDENDEDIADDEQGGA